MGFIPNKPGHHRFAFSNSSSTQYQTYARQYSKAKAGGIRCIYGWMSGAGVLSIATDVGKGIVIDYGKRKLAVICINTGAYIISPAVVVFTNVSKIVKDQKAYIAVLHSVLNVWKTQQI